MGKAAYITEKLNDICEYLRVDAGDDDAMVTACASAAYDYIVTAVGAYDETDDTAFMLLCALTQDMYDHRELTQSEQQLKLRQSFTYQSIILQLQMKHDTKEAEDEPVERDQSGTSEPQDNDNALSG